MEDYNDKEKHINISMVISILLTLISALFTILSYFKDTSSVYVTNFVALLAMNVIMISIWGISIKKEYKYKKTQKELQTDLINCKMECMESKKEVDEIAREKEKERIKWIKYLSDISSSIKNNSIHNNELLIKVPSEGDESYKRSELIINVEQYGNDKKKELLINDAEDYSNRLFEIYKKYCSDMLREVVKLETAYIKIKGYDIKVSATIKLLDRPFLYQSDSSSNYKVYTAFRDKETYEDKDDSGVPKREIGRKLYTVDGNVDFVHCLNRDTFVINNASRSNGNYRNEHEDFDKYYNCAIVVPIRAKHINGRKKYYGYLCCDCYNNENTAKEIFDKESAQFLFAFAQNLSTFIETLDTNWSERFSDNVVDGIPKSVTEMIYKKTMVS